MNDWMNDDGLKEVLSHENDEIVQELPRKISLRKEDTQEELDEEISSLDSLLVWLEELRTLDWFKQQRDNSLTERIEPITDHTLNCGAREVINF